MSDVTNNDERPPAADKYVSQIDPAFAQAWNSVFDPETPAETSEGGDQAGAPEGGDQTPAAPVEGTGAGSGSENAPTGGAEPTGPAGGGDAAPAPDPAGAGAPGEPASVGAGTSAPAAGSRSALNVDDVMPSFATASTQIESRMEESFKTSALQEIREKIDQKYFDALAKHPLQLVGTEVPHVNPGQPNMTLRDSQQAREWQEATTHLLDAEVKDLVEQKKEGIRPFMNVVQESMLLFQNNRDLIPGTAQYDSELAKKFTDMAEAYELRVNGKLYGYHVDVQPLINSVRQDLATSRGASGERSRSEQQREHASQQARNEQGQFDAPQAGISSKTPHSGTPSDDDFSTFWKGVGMPGISI